MVLVIRYALYKIWSFFLANRYKQGSMAQTVYYIVIYSIVSHYYGFLAIKVDLSLLTTPQILTMDV